MKKNKAQSLASKQKYQFYRQKYKSLQKKHRSQSKHQNFDLKHLTEEMFEEIVETFSQTLRRNLDIKQQIIKEEKSLDITI